MYAINIYMGGTGAGKSTYSAYLSKQYLKKGLNVYSNVEIKGTKKITLDDLFNYNISDGLVIFDEAGLEFDSRNFKAFKDNYVKFFKLHRHYNLDIALFTQFYDDVDKKIRNITKNIFHIKKSIFPRFIALRRIHSYITVDENNDIVLKYQYASLLSIKRIYAPRYYKYFNSFHRIELPEKDFQVY